MLRITLADRRARLAVRHHLARSARAADPTQVAQSLSCFHATDPATVYLSAYSRLRRPSLGAVERALYEERTLVRMLAMRRTMFVVPTDEAGLFHGATSGTLLRTERRRNVQLAQLAGIKRPESWLKAAERDALAALEARGDATPQELALDVPALRVRIRMNQGKAYEGEISMASRVLLILAIEGKVVRGRPRGSWLSSQYRWAPMSRWLDGPLPHIPEVESQAGIVRRWLESFGPGTETDLRWWTGWTQAAVRRALDLVGAVAVELEGGGTGYILPGDDQPVRRVGPWVALLPALDPTTMGWKERHWYLGEHGRLLFDRNGNAGPTIWADGRIVGGWTILGNGEVVTRLLDDIGRDRRAMVEQEAERLTVWLDGIAVVPRFPTPLQREIEGGKGRSKAVGGGKERAKAGGGGQGRMMAGKGGRGRSS